MKCPRNRGNSTLKKKPRRCFGGVEKLLPTSSLLEGDEGGRWIAENQMVNKLHPDGLCGFGKLPREVEVLRAGRGVAARVVVENDDAGRVNK